MFQVYVLNVSFVSYVCCKCFNKMLHIYESVLSVFICTVQVFSSVCCNICNGYTRVFKFFWCSANISDVCCKYFSYFGYMLLVFHLNVAKVYCMLHKLNGIHLSQPLAAAAGAPPSGQTVLKRRAARETSGRRGPCMGTRNE
jgi:hypothetical protein